MTTYEQVLYAEQLVGYNGDNTVEIKEIATGFGGVANSCDGGMVAVYYGEDDSKDSEVIVETISADDFNKRFVITCIVLD